MKNNYKAKTFTKTKQKKNMDQQQQPLPPPPLIDMSIFNITKSETVVPVVVVENEKAKKATRARKNLRSDPKFANQFTDSTCFSSGLHTPSKYPDGRLFYDVQAYNLTRKELGGFYVYPIVNDELPTVFQAETYNNEVLYNTIENAKISQDHNEALTNAIKHKYETKEESIITTQVRVFSNFTKKNKSAIHYDMLLDGIFTGALIYDFSIDEQGREFLANKNKKRLLEVVHKYYSRLLRMNQTSPLMLNNLAHIIWYMQGKTYFEKEKIAFAKSLDVMGGTLNRYCASLTLYNDPLPIFWMIFSIRKTATPIMRASLVLHGWCQSLLGMAMMDASENKAYHGETFKGLGPFVLSFLINIASSIANMPIYAMYMESLPGTDKTIQNMKIIANNDRNIIKDDDLKDMPPYLTYTDYESQFKKEMRKNRTNPLSDYDVDILYAGTGKAGRFLPDKLIMERTVVDLWRRWIVDDKSIPKAPSMQYFPTAKADDGEELQSSLKRLKSAKVCITCKITNPQYAPGGNRKLGLYCGGHECY
jgi:hypothetical protein